jgi:hypothetical protein
MMRMTNALLQNRFRLQPWIYRTLTPTVGVCWWKASFQLPARLT